MSDKQQEMMERIYGKINSILLPKDVESKESSSGFISLMLPGETINPNDYDVSDEAISLQSKVNLYKKMNSIPKYNKVYMDSSNTVSGMFEQILGANLPADNIVEKRKKEAEFIENQDILDKYGEKYYQYESEYNQVLSDYQMLKIDCEESPNSKKLQAGLKVAKNKVSTAYDKWVSLGKKTYVENALNIIKMYMAYSPVSLFAEAKEVYEFEKENSIDNILPVLCLPESWATESEDLSWTSISIVETKDSFNKNTSSQTTISTWGKGLLFVSDNGSSTEITNSVSESVEFDSCKIDFEIARVSVNRSWFNSNLMNIQGISMDGMKKGEFSAGSLENIKNTKNSFIPTAFILARNIKITIDMAKSFSENFNRRLMSHSTKRVGIGPFCISSPKSENKTFTRVQKNNNVDEFKFEIDDKIQLIGVINSLLPVFPTANDEKLASLKKLPEYKDKDFSKFPQHTKEMFKRIDRTNNNYYGKVNKNGRDSNKKY